MGRRSNGGPIGKTKSAVKKASGPALLQESSLSGIFWKSRMDAIKSSQTQLASEPLEPHVQSLAGRPTTADEKTNNVLLCVLLAIESL